MVDQAVGGYRLGDIVTDLGGELLGSPELRINSLGTLQGATPQTLSFLANPKYNAQLAGSQAACVIVAPSLREQAVARGAALITPDPYLYFARLTQWWANRTRAPAVTGVHPTAVVHATASIGVGVSVGPLAVIEARASIGDHVAIGSQCHIGEDATVGAYTRLAPRVVLGAGCVMGQRGLVHSGVVIGADGFGFAPRQGEWEKIAQLGAVRIGDDVEIGANTCIDRGALQDTVIEDGVKLDNLIQIAHNVRIGAHTAIAGCTGIAGSTVIGKHCTIAGAANIIGHLTIADHVHISVATVVTRSISKPGVYSGSFPFDDNAAWEKNAATLRQLHRMRTRLMLLEKKLESTPENDLPTAPKKNTP
ncbi:MAG: UDP-3-O-(3-hydroxymyristoyl)glucosamine N-acyltransferase [Rhizobacter sp.]